MRTRLWASVLTRTLITVVLAAGALSCGDDAADGRVATEPRVGVTLPDRLLGLEVVEEDVAENVEGVSDTYLQSLGLFSLRESNDLLRATLQIGRFNEVAENQRQRFRDSIVGQLGTSVPVELRVGDERLFLASGSEQSLYAWFDDEGFYVLSVRGDYPFPRTLVRRLLDLEMLV